MDKKAKQADPVPSLPPLSFVPVRVSSDCRRPTALLDRLLHHAVVIQIEGSSYCLRQHADLVPEHVRSKAHINPPPLPKKRGRPPGVKSDDQDAG